MHLYDEVRGILLTWVNWNRFTDNRRDSMLYMPPKTSRISNE